MAHTMKQLEAEMKRTAADLKEWKKRMEEAIAEGSPAHLVAYDEKWVKHYEKRLAELEAELPAAIDKEIAKEAKKTEQEAAKKRADEYVYYQRGCMFYGITPNGKRWTAERNHYGMTDRTLHCFTMWIEGQGMVFTSGTLNHVIETAIKN